MKEIKELVGPITHLTAMEAPEKDVMSEITAGKEGKGSVSFTIPPDKSSLIIGKGGSTLKVFS